MSRSNQPMGLCERAIQFLKDCACVPEMCPCCKRPLPVVNEQIGTYYGYWDEEFPLHKHKLKNGWFAEEYLQTTEFCGGPMMFLGLRIPGGVIEWTDEEIQAHVD